eukprot:g37411.t1
MAVSLLHGLGPVRKDQYAGKSSWHLEPQSTVTECCFPKEDVPNGDDFFVFTCTSSEMTENRLRIQSTFINLRRQRMTLNK